jgi:hypothetical protein
MLQQIGFQARAVHVCGLWMHAARIQQHALAFLY